MGSSVEEKKMHYRLSDSVRYLTAKDIAELASLPIHSSIPHRSLNRCPCFWAKVHRFGHLSPNLSPRVEHGTEPASVIRAR